MTVIQRKRGKIGNAKQKTRENELAEPWRDLPNTHFLGRRLPKLSERILKEPRISAAEITELEKCYLITYVCPTVQASLGNTHDVTVLCFYMVPYPPCHIILGISLWTIPVHVFNTNHLDYSPCCHALNRESFPMGDPLAWHQQTHMKRGSGIFDFLGRHFEDALSHHCASPLS